MFRFTFVFVNIMVTVLINPKAQCWTMWADDMVTGEPNNCVWDWDQFLPAFEQAMAERGMTPEIRTWNGHTYLQRWEDHTFNEKGEYMYSSATGYFEYIDDLVYDEIVMPKMESTAPARQSWNWWGGSSKELRDFKRRVRRYNRWVK